ncbi:hypothetical protein LCGC14_1441460 [marine sediment metagenome]|uniref:ERAP1-like C-terminal domain-containing protein n=2 Tax=root TaxID=1 RepID=A0A831QS50_9FLAO|nr:hypothetical protein [Pricia sp.]HEA23593.1 hypothetical protein [Pricia antarctica]
MRLADTATLKKVLNSNIESSTMKWIEDRLYGIVEEKSAKNLFMTYSLLASKVKASKELIFSNLNNDRLTNYLSLQKANNLQVARIYLLSRVLEENNDYFQSKVANLIQVADSSELETFLKFLILLPNPENYKQAAIEALRTNIATVFDAISADNPYPATYFTDQQWNQMYLKAAFMQQDLSRILDIDKRANAELARIISDYAHERWAASRDVDPYFWRPVGNFLGDNLLNDMERLLRSDRIEENRAGALCCLQSDTAKAEALLMKYPDVKDSVVNGNITWYNLVN